MGITDSSYKEIANQAYNVEPNKAKSNDTEPTIINDIITDPITNKEYLVLDTQDNNNDADTTNDNGMQAMAVAPIIDGKLDTSQIVIAYARINDADTRDMDTDFQMVMKNK
ncbi:hypothetical protein MKL26_07785 [Streptococcus suis]|nr:hypothetical protein [Streptococcus suis]